ncbi:MAG: undecaprenyl-diphosphate phosphatase [Clostridia bacterium]|nr:undecaprenyl-diphosphate phosphatase [Clostridia bacterium]
MEIWQAIILGAVQGFAEFMPISSSGHLILLERWFGIKNNVLFYSVMLHFGTLIPLLIVYKKQIISLFKKPFDKLFYLILATIPAGIIGLTASCFFDLDLLFSNKTYLIGITFLLTALELFLTENFCKKKSNLLTRKIDFKSSITMGIGQALAIFPGLSRSGTTLAFGTIAKLEKNENADFTFLMSIPIILSAVMLEGIKTIKNGEIVDIQIIPLLFGIISASVCGYIAITKMIRVIKKANYKVFYIYLIIMSIASFITGG